MNPIRHIRQNVLKISQAELAVIANVTQGTVSRWERDELHPSLAEMQAIRSAAMDRGAKWRDSLFFDAPAPATPTPQNHEAA